MKIFLTFSLIALFITSCNNTPKSSIENDITNINVVLDWLPNTNHTGMFIAKELGFYESNGLDVEIISAMEDGALPLVSSGKADFGISYQEEIGQSLASSTPMSVTAIATILQHNTTGIISLKENNITRPIDMENHTYATWNSPVEQAVLKSVITNDGGDFKKLQQIPQTVFDALIALQTNIDTLWIFYAWDVVAINHKGIDTNFFYFRDFNETLDYYTPVIAANEKFLNENPEIAKAFLKATAQGYEYAIENPVEAAEIVTKYAPELDFDIAVLSQEYLAGEYKAEVERWGYIDQTRWDNFYTWLYEEDALPKKLEEGQGFTNDFLPN